MVHGGTSSLKGSALLSLGLFPIHCSFLFSLCLVASRLVFFSIFFRNASSRSTPVWLARQISTNNTSAISSARFTSSSDFLKDWSPYFRAMIRETSPTSSISIAILVNSEKYRTPILLIQSSTVFCASCNVIVEYSV